MITPNPDDMSTTTFSGRLYVQWFGSEVTILIGDDQQDISALLIELDGQYVTVTIQHDEAADGEQGVLNTPAEVMEQMNRESAAEAPDGDWTCDVCGAVTPRDHGHVCRSNPDGRNEFTGEGMTDAEYMANPDGEA